MSTKHISTEEKAGEVSWAESCSNEIASQATPQPTSKVSQSEGDGQGWNLVVNKKQDRSESPFPQRGVYRKNRNSRKNINVENISTNPISNERTSSTTEQQQQVVQNGVSTDPASASVSSASVLSDADKKADPEKYVDAPAPKTNPWSKSKPMVVEQKPVLESTMEKGNSIVDTHKEVIEQVESVKVVESTPTIIQNNVILEIPAPPAKSAWAKHPVDKKLSQGHLTTQVEELHLEQGIKTVETLETWPALQEAARDEATTSMESNLVNAVASPRVSKQKKPKKAKPASSLNEWTPVTETTKVVDGDHNEEHGENDSSSSKEPGLLSEPTTPGGKKGKLRWRQMPPNDIEVKPRVSNRGGFRRHGGQNNSNNNILSANNRGGDTTEYREGNRIPKKKFPNGPRSGAGDQRGTRGRGGSRGGRGGSSGRGGRAPYRPGSNKSKFGNNNNQFVEESHQQVANGDGYVSCEEHNTHAYQVGRYQHQLAYYFSEQNLNGDFLIRESMDPDGYISLNWVLHFAKLKVIEKEMGDRYPEDPLEIVKDIPSLEVNEDGTKIRVRHDPIKWVLGGQFVNKSLTDPVVASSTLNIMAKAFVPAWVSNSVQVSDTGVNMDASRPSVIPASAASAPSAPSAPSAEEGQWIAVNKKSTPTRNETGKKSGANN